MLQPCRRRGEERQVLAAALHEAAQVRGAGVGCGAVELDRLLAREGRREDEPHARGVVGGAELDLGDMALSRCRCALGVISMNLRGLRGRAATWSWLVIGGDRDSAGMRCSCRLLAVWVWHRHRVSAVRHVRHVRHMRHVRHVRHVQMSRQVQIEGVRRLGGERRDGAHHRLRNHHDGDVTHPPRPQPRHHRALLLRVGVGVRVRVGLGH
eukprot:scaffold108592_cov56-Phaeocystis_antarctica.AAC.1